MTPTEKAKELVDKFRPYADRGIQDSERNEIESAKQCALICVEEIDKAIDFDWMEVQNLDREHAYWNEVKREIEKL